MDSYLHLLNSYYGYYKQNTGFVCESTYMTLKLINVKQNHTIENTGEILETPVLIFSYDQRS